MKQLKLFTLGLALVAGMSLTSCLNDNSEPIDGRFGVIAKMYSTYYTTFRTPGDNPVTITPTESSINSLESNNPNFNISSLSGEIVAVDYTWNPDLIQFPADATQYDGVTLTSIQALDAPTLVIRADEVGSERDSVATHPIITINPQINGYTYKPYFFDDNHLDIIVPVQYYFPYNTQATAASISLVYYPDDAQTIADKENGILRLHLNYRVRGVEDFSTQYKSSDLTYYGGLHIFYKAYRLNHSSDKGDTNILNAWGGSLPSGVNLVVTENQYSANLDDPQTETGVVYPVLTYEEFADSFAN